MQDYLKYFPPLETKKEIAALAPEGVADVPWWWMDNSGQRLLAGILRVLAVGSAFLMALFGIVVAVSANVAHPLWAAEIPAWVFVGIESLFLWMAPLFSLLRAFSWGGYGANKPSFSLAVLYRDLREMP